MERRIEKSVGDAKFLTKTRITLDRANMKMREKLLEHLGRTVSDFCAQIDASGLGWAQLKKRLGEEGWQTSIVFTRHMYEAIEAKGDEFAAMPWRLITISLSPVRRATDATPSQHEWLDRLIEEAQRHCILLKKMQKSA